VIGIDDRGFRRKLESLSPSRGVDLRG
jgi:hypothetical protein